MMLTSCQNRSLNRNRLIDIDSNSSILPSTTILKRITKIIFTTITGMYGYSRSALFNPNAQPRLVCSITYTKDKNSQLVNDILSESNFQQRKKESVTSCYGVHVPIRKTKFLPQAHASYMTSIP